MNKLVKSLFFASFIIAAWTQQNQNVYALEQFFPVKTQYGSKMAWLKGAGNTPIVLRPSSFEEKANIRQRQSVSVSEDSLPYFKESKIVTGEELDTLALMENAPVEDPKVLVKMKEIYEDKISLINGAKATQEQYRSLALCNGIIVTEGNGGLTAIDYGLESKQKETLVTLWSDPKADILGDIRRHKKIARKRTGLTLDVAMCGSTVVEYMMKNEGILNYIKQVSNKDLTDIFVDEELVIEAVKKATKITILVNDDMYRDDESKFYRFWDETKFTLFSSQVNPGRTVCGTTPQTHLMGKDGYDVESVDDEIYVLTKWIDDPVTKQTIVDMTCAPSGEGMHTVQILTVLAA